MRSPAFAMSLGWHVFVILLITFFMRPSAGGHDNRNAPIDASNARIVWIPEAGLGGGGGGGGNRMSDPPRPAQVVSPIRERAVDISRQASIESEPTREPNPAPAIPAATVGADLQNLPGTIETATATNPLSQGPGRNGGSGTGIGPGDGPGRGSGLGDGLDQGIGGGWFQPGNGVIAPTELRRATPQYTTAAMQARLQGTVLLACVVTTNGVCADIRVVRSLDSTYGLDQEAVKAAERWRFKPGTRLGRPVPVLVTMEVTFTLR